MTSDDKNVFTFKPLTYQSAVSFVQESSVLLTQRSIADELARPPHPAHRADRHGNDEIDATRFTEEIKETQPFLFFPEMNKSKKQRVTIVKAELSWRDRYYRLVVCVQAFSVGLVLVRFSHIMSGLLITHSELLTASLDACDIEGRGNSILA